MPPLFGRPMKRKRWGLAEQGLVFAGETAEMPEAVLRGELCHSGSVSRCLAQCSPRQVQAAEQQVVLWSHPQLLLAAHPQGPLRNPDRLADLRDIEWLTRVFLHHPAKPAHDQLVLPLCHAVLASLTIAEAFDHRLYKRLLQPARGVGIGDDFRRLFRQTPG